MPVMTQAQMRKEAIELINTAPIEAVKTFLTTVKNSTKKKKTTLTADDKYNMKVLGITSTKEYCDVLAAEKEADNDRENGRFTVMETPTDIEKWRQEVLAS